MDASNNIVLSTEKQTKADTQPSTYRSNREHFQTLKAGEKMSAGMKHLLRK